MAWSLLHNYLLVSFPSLRSGFMIHASVVWLDFKGVTFADDRLTRGAYGSRRVTFSSSQRTPHRVAQNTHAAATSRKTFCQDRERVLSKQPVLGTLLVGVSHAIDMVPGDICHILAHRISSI